MSETLTQFGTSFQSKIIASLLRDVKFIQTIRKQIEKMRRQTLMCEKHK